MFRFRNFLAGKVRAARSLYLRRVAGYSNISPSAIIEGGVMLDKIYRHNVCIGDGCLVARGSVILTHEHAYRDSNDPSIPYGAVTKIGRNCFVGINAMICPGVSVGDDCIIAGGAIVTKDVPSGSLVAGVPASVKKSGLKLQHGAFI